MTAEQTFFHPAALEEAEAAARWYHERSPRAAARFVGELNRVIDKIVDAPQRWPHGPGGTRRVNLPCFPFAVIYRESDEGIQNSGHRTWAASPRLLEKQALERPARAKQRLVSGQSCYQCKTTRTRCLAPLISEC